MTGAQDFSDLFASEPVKSPLSASAEPLKVLLVDDAPDMHAVLRLAAQDIQMDGRPLQLLDALSTQEAKICLADHPDIALVLLDVVMETERAGLDLVRHIRQTMANRMCQIILVTGQPGYAPQRVVAAQYEIDGYCLKSELTADKIFVALCAALRTHKALVELEQQKLSCAPSSEPFPTWSGSRIPTACT